LVMGLVLVIVLGLHTRLRTARRPSADAYAKALSNKEIARRLEISEGTVKVHLQHMYRKLGIRNRTMLAVLAAGSDIGLFAGKPAA